MGVVYRAQDEKLGREVAIKLLTEEVAGDRERLARFQREARVLAALNHPHVVTIHAIEEGALGPFIVMELVAGRSLQEELLTRSLELHEVLSIGVQMAAAVAAAHRNGVVHRDLKPGNVMVSGDGWVKVLDFGLAKLDGRARGSTDELETAVGAPLTGVGSVLGTLPYMAPEQVCGRPARTASDIYALGVVLYEMATGRRPATGASSVELASSILKDVPPAPSTLRPGLPEGFDRLVMRCLEKDTEARHHSADELVEALRKLQQPRAVSRSDDLSADSALLIPAPARTYEAPLVGREAEVGRLLELIDRAAAGNGALITLSGEPGVGKTRLAWELVAKARARGFLTLAGSCYENEGTPAFNPWVEVMRSAIERVPREVLAELLAGSGPEIAKLLPELRRLFPDLPAALELPPAEGRRYLFRCFVELLARSSRRQPLLLLLEDLHWADEPTLLLLQQVANQIAAMRVAVVATYRDADLQLGRPLAASLEELVRGRLVQRISLDRLPVAGVAAMLATLCGKAAPAELARAIHAETEGNPFFVEEVVAHLQAEGRLLNEAGDFRADLSLSELEVPESIRLVLDKRLQRLGEPGTEVLRIAAVLGRRFSYSLLETVAAATEPGGDVLVRIEAAEHARLIEAEKRSPGGAGGSWLGDRGPTFRFAHELVRQTLLQGLSMPRRQRLHARVAVAVEGLDRSEHLASVLAHHFFEAGGLVDEAKTRQYLLLAGKQALASAAFEEALRQCQRLRELTDETQTGAWAQLLALEGEALHYVGRADAAEDNLGTAIAMWERLDNRSEVARLCHLLSDVIGWKARPREAAEVSIRGLNALGPEPSVNRAHALCDVLLWQGFAESGHAETERRLQEAEATLRQIDDAGVNARVLSARFHIALFTYRLHLARESRDRLRDGGAWAHLPAWDALRLAQNSAWGLQLAGLWSEASRERSEARRMHERFGNAVGLALQTDFEQFERRAVYGELDPEDLRAIGDRAIDQRTLGGWLVVRVWDRAVARLWQGRWEEALEDLRREFPLSPLNTFADGTGASYEMLAAAMLGRGEDFDRLLDTHRSVLPKADRLSTGGSWELAFSVTEATALLGREDEAAALYPQLEQARAQGVIVRWGAHRLVETLLGIASACAGDHERCDVHFAAAVRQAEELPLVTERAEARRWWAWALGRRCGGERARARDRLREALDIYTALGLERHRASAAALLD